MIAVILNSGVGSRMGQLTKDVPKCLVQVDSGSTILYRQLDALQKYGIDRVVITTGPFEQSLIDHAVQNFSNMSFEFIHNSLYRTTNYIYSLFLLRSVLNEECILMHGDLVFENEVLDRLLSFNHDGVLVNFNGPIPQKNFKARTQDGLVKQIGVDLVGSDCFLLIPMYKLSEFTIREWLTSITSFVEKGHVEVYAENALNMILGKLQLHAVPFSNELCTEIDDIDDLRHVLKILERA